MCVYHRNKCHYLFTNLFTNAFGTLHPNTVTFLLILDLADNSQTRNFVYIYHKHITLHSNFIEL